MNPLQNLRAAWLGVLQSTVAATLAWFLAQWLLGHVRPSFAAIAAIVCLSPGLASRGRQAVGLVAGVAVGVAVGEAAKRLGSDPVWPMALSATVAMFAAVCFSMQPVLIIQAGASAILVVATGEATGYARLADAAVGAALGLLGSQVLLTPDPVRLLEKAFAQVAVAVADGLASSERAVSERREAAMRPALEHQRNALRHSANLTGQWEEARRMARWTLRGRLAAARVAVWEGRCCRYTPALCAAALALGEGLRVAFDGPDLPPANLVRVLGELAQACRELPRLPTKNFVPVPAFDGTSSAAWRRCEASLGLLMECVQACGLLSRIDDGG